MRAIPSIEQLRQRPAMRALQQAFGHDALVDALRAEVDAVRRRIAAGENPSDIAAAIDAALPARLASIAGASLRPVINATGVIVHTNLGRAPLADAAVARVAALAAYSNLEYDLDGGQRGRRDIHAERLICRLIRSEAAVVVNNNAAAALLVHAALAAGREVIISRGELVEIGGGFRVPDVMKQSGALLREVGTTNRTRTADYAAAIGDRTAAILRVHPSNFRIEGFTERAPLSELVALSRRFNVPLIEDIGSGAIAMSPALADEPTPLASIAAGVDVVLFSGDKLLGGPQAGIIAGRKDAIEQIRRHPLMRALRASKLTYAALEATLQEHAAGRAAETVPVVRMIAMTVGEIEKRAVAIARRVDSALEVTVVDSTSRIGGGSAPGAQLATRALAIRHPRLSAQQIEAILRAGDPPAIVRIEDERVLVDLRTVEEKDDEQIAAALARIARDGDPSGRTA